jgi:hypothetical protein
MALPDSAELSGDPCTVETPSTERSVAPRRSAIHLALWGLGAICFFAIHEFVIHGLDPWPAAGELMRICVVSLTSGVAWGTILAAPAWRKQGYRFPTYGGEWLLIIAGFLALMQMSSDVVLATVNEPPIWLLNRMLNVSLLGVGILCYWLFCGWKTSRPAWTWFFGGMAVYLTALAFAGSPLSPDVRAALWPWLQLGGQVVLFMLLAAAVSFDLQSSVPAPWTHWLGVGVYLINLASRVIEFVASQNQV